MVNGGKAYSTSGVLACRMYKNGADAFGTAAQWSPSEGTGVGSNHSFMYLDSPSTTSAITYTPYYRSALGTTAFFADTPSFWGNVYITAMEIQG
jgi:hypothetical protein